jgi:hypothetical protein
LGLNRQLVQQKIEMPATLNEYARNVFSQFGEDGIIERVFKILPEQENYWCVEFGAWDGKYLSNTHELVANKHWKGVLIEGNAKKFIDLKETYRNNPNAIPINRMVSFEGANTLDKIFAGTPLPLDFDLLSIDIDGSDYHVWESLREYHPKVVIVEFNQTIPSDIDFVQAKDFSLNHGSSILAMTRLAQRKGYELIAATVNNAFFVRKEFHHLFGIADNSISALWNKEPAAPRIFQLYDGTLVVSEKFKLVWHERYVDRFELQALPKPLRFFGDSPNLRGSIKQVLRKLYYRWLPESRKRR